MPLIRMTSMNNLSETTQVDTREDDEADVQLLVKSLFLRLCITILKRVACIYLNFSLVYFKNATPF